MSQILLSQERADVMAPSSLLETIAVIVPTALVEGSAGRPLVMDCLESLVPAIESPEETASDGLPIVRQIVLVTQGRLLEASVLQRLASAEVTITQVDLPGPFNFSRKINAGAGVANADVLLLLNDDAQVRGSDWPHIFLDVLADHSIAAVSPVILNPDGTLNAAGDALLRDGARHVDALDLRFRPGMAEILARDHDVSLLTAAALAIPRRVFRSVGGFDEAFPSSFGDTDLCLRLRASGHRLVCTPRATVVHQESSSRNPDVPAKTVQLLRRAHREALRDDPLLPPMVVPARVRVARAFAPSIRVVYRLTLRRLVPSGARRQIRDAAHSRGWFRR